MKSNSFLKDASIIGFALFAMFFGAGNLIFPPYLGFGSASNWFWAFLAFILTDIGLSMLALLVIAKKGKGAEGLTEVLGEKSSKLIIFANTLCLGPLIAIPRTAATTFEFAVEPLFPPFFNTWVSGILFFLIVVVLCFKQSKIMDIVGSVLSPLMLVALALLIIRGILSPLGIPSVGNTQIGEVFTKGIKAGYQTMDMMGAMIFSFTVISTITQKGYHNKKSQYKIITVSGLIASAGLFLTYCGLAFLGASVSTVFPAHLSQSELLIHITRGILGKEGVILLGIIVSAACLTTAIGLVSSCSEYFCGICNGKVNYKVFVILISLVSLTISNFGISEIIRLAAPILGLIYPVLVVLAILAIFSHKITNDNIYKGAALGAFLTAVLTLFEEFLKMPEITACLPFAKYGFSWLLPSVIGGILGLLLKRKNSNITLKN